MTDFDRRKFLGAALTVTACRGATSDPPAPSAAAAVQALPAGQPQGIAEVALGKHEVPLRLLGSTGVQVSMIGLGGAHIGKQRDEKESIAIIQSAIDRGVTFLDNCWDYNEGKSEERMGKALLGGYRQKAFLMTKLDGRSKKVATEQLEQSLQRLRTDRIDLVQIHEVIRPEDPEACFREGGCIEALVQAREQGKVRFIGFTGHKDPAFHLAMLKKADQHGFRFDTVQMPLSVMDAHYNSFEAQVLPVLIEKQTGVLGMKALGAGIILESKTVSAVECLNYALSLPTSVVITGCEKMEILDQAIDAARHFQPLTPAQRTQLLDKTREAAAQGKFEKFKTSQMFDGTSKNPHWLTTAQVSP